LSNDANPFEIDAIPLALALFNEKREMIYFNSGMNEFLLIHGLGRGDKRLLERIAGGGNSAHGDPLDAKAAALFNGQIENPGVFTADIALLGDNGPDNFMLSLRRLRREQGGPLRVMLLLNDVTLLTRAKLDAEAASRSKSEFLSRMTHEIRTPMNVIMGMTRIAKNALALPDLAKARVSLDQVESSSSRLLGIIDDILDFSKIESGNLSFLIEEFSLVSNLDFVVSMMLPRAREKNIAIRLVMEPLTHEELEADSLRLNQVLLNLLSNAVKFSPEGSEVLLKVKELAAPPADLKEFSFEIIDHGIGISGSQAEHLFKPFEQADGSITRKYGGTGLGLAISKRLVEMMGGTIALKSREGEGSTFSFTIKCPARPKGEPAAAGGKAGAADALFYDFSGKRCLVVDDIEINRDIILDLLGNTGIIPETAEDGREAVEKFRASPEGYYHVILMDMQMPVLDGVSAARAIRSLSRSDAAGVPIIAMTANVLEEDIRKALDAGMNAHLGKPIDPDTMFKVLGGQLNINKVN
jgi:signal transduction histidine kinase/ActR/RegA family two-component response regulator